MSRGGGVSVQVRVVVDWEELRDLSPEQLEAFMAGIAKVAAMDRPSQQPPPEEPK